ncbi:MAG: hypothetical protein Q7T30_03905, partial [Planctomycetota bacterium]|nr:hypothetical protein [Planctomycetota bacterium]
MMLRASLLLLIAGLFCAAPPAQSPSPRRTLSEPTRKTLRERMGGEPFAVLAEWARAERRRGAPPPAWLPKSGEPRDTAFHELLHGGLWSEDKDTAYAAASLIGTSQLDIADIDRWLAAVEPHVFDEHPKHDFDTLKRVMSSADVAQLLDDPQCWFADIRTHFLQNLHRSMRPEHIPALAKLTHHEDPFVREGAWNILANLSVYTDSHRDVIARTLLERPGPGSVEVRDKWDRSRNPRHVPRAYTLPAPRAGWSPLLRAVLERRFLDLEPGKEGSSFGAFLMRWAEDERPADEDRLLLRALLGSPQVDGICIALRAICRLGADAWLRRVLQEPPESAPKSLVLAARGDWRELRALAATDAEALAVALEFDFDGAWLPWVGEAFGDDATRGLVAIERLIDASSELRAPYRPTQKLTGQLRHAIDVFGGKLDFTRLHRLVVEFPAARSERLINLYWATTTPSNLAGSAVGVFEVSPFVDFPGRLREWARLSEPERRGPALDLLLRLGDAQLADELLAHWQAHHAEDPFLLARCAAAPHIREFLESRLRGLPWSADAKLTAEHFGALGSVAMLHGLPEAVARNWEHAEASNRAYFPTWREQVLGGEPVAALVGYLASVPPTD